MVPVVRHLLTVVLLLSLLCPTLAADRAAGVSASMRQRVHPVLIRNEYNPLLQLTVESNKADVFLYALTFSLQGTDDLRDIDRLQLFSTGEADKYTIEVTFATVFGPAPS